MRPDVDRTLLEGLLGSVRRREGLEQYVAPALSADEAASLLQPIADAAAIEIHWLGLNGLRADAQVLSGDRREWRVVFTIDDASRLTRLWVFERPATFQGVDGGRAIVIDGAVGAGKSSLIERFAQAEDTPWVVFDEVNFGKIHTSHLIWLETCGPLYRGFLAGIAALAREGNQVIMPGSGLPQRMFLEALSDVPTLYVGLECPLPVLVDRNDGREGRWAGLTEQSFDHFVANGWRYDLVLDSATMSLDALVGELRTAVASIA